MNIDPIEVEHKFGLISAEIVRAGSERVQLLYIYNFLKLLNRRYLQFDSYIIQLFELFPSLQHPLLFTGFRPAELEDIIHECEDAIHEIRELHQNDAIHQKVDLLKTGLLHIKDWLGIREEDHAGKLQVISGKASGKSILQPGEVFIPVVEIADGFAEKGRLRKLRVDLVGKSAKEEFELRPVFGVIGANTGNLGEKPARAAGNLLRKNSDRSDYWSGTAAFELSHTWHAGASANLALASLFYCEMLKAENQREYFNINPGIAITGDVDEWGNVQVVDEKTIQQKVEAAFFSWAQVLVVPVQQLDKTAEILDELQEEFPERNLILKGIDNLRDLLFDRRLTLYKQTSLIEHTAKRVWKRRYSTATIAAFLILMMIIGRLAYGPIDQNPVSVSFAGEYMVLENDNGQEVSRVYAGISTIKLMQKDDSHHTNYAFYDIDKDGINEFIWANKTTATSTKKSFIQAISISGDTIIWEQNIELNYKFPNKYLETWQNLVINEILLLDNKIIVDGSLSTFFPNVIFQIDINNGAVEQEYVHVGGITDATIADYNDDGRDEVILTATNNAFWMASIIVLDPDNMHGHSPLQGDYRIEGIERATEIYYMLIPKTLIGNHLKYIEKANIGRRIFTKPNGKITIEISETVRKYGTVTEYASIYLHLNDKMHVDGIGTSDLYDIIARELYQSGDIPFIPNYDYFESFKDSLFYWNGDEFVNEPTMNGDYLEVVGEDPKAIPAE